MDAIDGFTKVCIAFIVVAVVACAGGVYLIGNYSYRWNQACAADNGVKLENTSGSVVCVKGPVQIITIAARPW